VLLLAMLLYKMMKILALSASFFPYPSLLPPDTNAHSNDLNPHREIILNPWCYATSVDVSNYTKSVIGRLTLP